MNPHTHELRIRRHCGFCGEYNETHGTWMLRYGDQKVAVRNTWWRSPDYVSKLLLRRAREIIARHDEQSRKAQEVESWKQRIEREIDEVLATTNDWPSNSWTKESASTRTTTSSSETEATTTANDVDTTDDRTSKRRGWKRK